MRQTLPLRFRCFMAFLKKLVHSRGKSRREHATSTTRLEHTSAQPLGFLDQPQTFPPQPDRSLAPSEGSFEKATPSTQPQHSSGRQQYVRVETPQTPDSSLSKTRQHISRGSNLGLQIVYEPNPTPLPSWDIVFVHGLTGNAYNTWLHKDNLVHWPSQVLHKDISNARIMMWGYDANVTSFWGHVGKNRLGEHAKNLMGDLVRLREDTTSVRRSVVLVILSVLILCRSPETSSSSVIALVDWSCKRR